jgi:hypothetical protein
MNVERFLIHNVSRRFIATMKYFLDLIKLDVTYLATGNYILSIQTNKGLFREQISKK